MGTCSEEMFGMLAPQEAEILRRVTLRARTVPHADVLILHTPPRDYATHTPTQRPKFVVWVPTTWHRNVYVDAGVEASKVVVVPEAVDVDFFDPEAAVAATHRRQPVEGVAVPDRVHEAGQRRRFVFFSVFKFEFRKGERDSDEIDRPGSEPDADVGNVIALPMTLSEPDADVGNATAVPMTLSEPDADVGNATVVPMTLSEPDAD
eukprot:gene491-883_t